MDRARMLAAAAALSAAACGGSSSTAPTAPASQPPPAYGPTLAPVVLDVGNFDALVLSSPSPCLVEFQRPT